MHLFASQNEQVRGYHKNLDFKLRHIVSLTVHKYAGISSEIRLSYNGYKTWTLLSSRFKNVKSVYPVQPIIHFHSPNTILEPQSENLDFNFDVNWSLTTKKLKMTSTMHEFKLNWPIFVGGRKPGVSQWGDKICKICLSSPKWNLGSLEGKPGL